MDFDQVIATLGAIDKLNNANNQTHGGYVFDFSKPVSFHVGRRRFQDVRTFRFSAYRIKDGAFYVAINRNARYIYPLVFKWEQPGDSLFTSVSVVRTAAAKNNAFESYEAFAKRFDLRFISESRIKELWTSGSSQHSGPYRRSDFRQISVAGKPVMQAFLLAFNRWDKATDRYVDGRLYRAHYAREGTRGRDISIEHMAGRDLVHYASEFPGCGNGQYYIVVNANTVLHIEND
jgi:hypothetical protein